MFLFFLNLAILKWVVSRKKNNPNVEKSLRRSVLDFFFKGSLQKKKIADFET